MRRLTDDIVLSVKDQLRNIRYSIRNEAEATIRAALPRQGLPMPVEALGLLGSPVARLADGVLTQVENVTLTLLSADRDARDGIRFPCSIERYFSADASGPPFTATHYHLVKDVLQRAGAINLLVFEHAIEQAHAALLARHGDLIWSAEAREGADPAARRWALARICAAVTVELVAARPIQKVDFGAAQGAAARHAMLSPNLYGFLVLGLASAVASLNPVETVEAPEILDSACAVVDARFGRFNAASQAKDPVEALARAFLGVVDFLP
jgi:hypothetical protein